MEIFLWRIGTGMNLRISNFSDGNISPWRIGTGMNFRISELSDICFDVWLKHAELKQGL